MVLLMKSSKMKIVFLNQMAGQLFRELIEDMAKEWSPSLLYSGYPHTTLTQDNESIIFATGPRYDRQSTIKRISSWLHFFIKSFFVVGGQPKSALLFIVSNPPFLGLVGLFFKLDRKQKYVVLVYDVYPDVLIALGTIANGLIAKVWRFINRLTLERAAIVFTISRDMAELLEQSYDFRRTTAGMAVVIPNWADVENIKPLNKMDNWFAIKHGQIGKTTILYSGNMGNTHDIESILAVAIKLRENDHIHFMFIGEGAKSSLVERSIREDCLTNITLLPYQPEDVLPFSLTAGDIGIVAYQPGTEGCIVPSKTYYYMSAGLVPLVFCRSETDLSRMVEENNCEIVVRSGDIDNLANAILRLSEDAALLSSYKLRSRSTAEQFFSRGNTALFVKSIKKYLTNTNDARTFSA